MQTYMPPAPPSPRNTRMSLKLPDFCDRTAEQHLSLLNPDPTAKFIFFTCPEPKRLRPDPRHDVGTFSKILPYLKRRQLAGCGVFVTVNPMTGNRRRKADVARVAAVWRERDVQCDHVLPIMPSLVIRTSVVDGIEKGHDYWLVDPLEPLSVAEAEFINKLLATHYGGDAAACDSARVLRLAGTWHLKGEPQRVEIVGGTGRRYSRRDLLAAFPPPSLPPRNRVPMTVSHPDRYVAGAIRGIAEDLAKAPNGRRNPVLNAAAYRLARLGVNHQEVKSILAPVAGALGLGAVEIDKTIASGWSAGARVVGAL